MKLLYFDDFKLGVLKGDSVVDVSEAVRDIPHTGPHNLISGLIERYADYRAALERSAAAGKGGELHGRRHPQGAGADQRVSQVAGSRYRGQRHDDTARRAGGDIRR